MSPARVKMSLFTHIFMYLNVNGRKGRKSASQKSAESMDIDAIYLTLLIIIKYYIFSYPNSLSEVTGDRFEF